MFREEFRWEDVIQDDKDIEVPLARDQAINVAAMKQKLEVWVKKAIEV